MHWLALGVVVLVGCKRDAPAPAASESGSASAARPRDAAVDAAPDAPVDAAAAANLIDEDGVGPIRVDLDLEDLRQLDDLTAPFAKLLPGFAFSHQVHIDESYEVTEVFAARGKTPALRIVLDHYRSGSPLKVVEVFDRAFATLSGVTAGMTVAEAAAKHADLACKLETYDPDADIFRVERRLYCETAAAPYATFELDPKAWRKPGPVPVAKLADRPITAITWVAD